MTDSKHSKIEYLFSINTGRSGSQYLCNIFEQIENCQAYHEPNPVGYGQVMRKHSSGDHEFMKNFMIQKIESIQKLKKDSRYYVETNHCFIKGFGWYIPEYIPQEKIGIIILTRDINKIVNSTLRIGCTPLNSRGRHWILTPDIENYHLEPPNWFISPQITYSLLRLLNRPFYSERKLYDILNLRSEKIKKIITTYEQESVKWYVNETTALGKLYQEKFPNIRYFQTNIDSLNNMENVRKLLDYFEIHETNNIEKVIGKPVNLKR